MVWGGDVTTAAHSASRSNVDLEVGCLIDLATGLLTFTVNGKEISTSYQVLHARSFPTVGLHLSCNAPLVHSINPMHVPGDVSALPISARSPKREL